HGLPTGFYDGLRLVLGGFDDPAQTDQPVEARWLGLDLGRQLAGQGDVAAKHVAVDADRRWRRAVDRQVGRDIAAANALRQRGAQLRLQRIEAGRQAQAEIKRLAVDAFQFPGPGNTLDLAVGAGKPGHAGDSHAGSLFRWNLAAMAARQSRARP